MNIQVFPPIALLILVIEIDTSDGMTKFQASKTYESFIRFPLIWLVFLLI